MYRWAIMLFMLLLSFRAQAHAIEPFTAQYDLKVNGWPEAHVQHRLARQDGIWTSIMEASLKIATGREFGRFRVEGDHLQALDYYSRYRLFGFGNDYRMDASTMATRPDRQTALVTMSRHIDTASCHGRHQTPCELDYLDHKHKAHTMAYRVIGRQEIDVPAGQWQTTHVEAWDEDKPKRRLHFYFSPQYPGLLVQMNYFKNGELDSHMEMTQFTSGTSD